MQQQLVVGDRERGVLGVGGRGGMGGISTTRPRHPPVSGRYNGGVGGGRSGGSPGEVVEKSAGQLRRDVQP